MGFSRRARESWQIAATFVGTIVGAGFATGKEIVQFFTQYGAWGTLGILVSGFLFIWIGTKIMLLAALIKARSYKDLSIYLFGETIGTIFNGIILFVLFGVTAVMLSGAGAVFQEQIGWPFQLGLLVTILLCYISLKKGLNGVMAVNTLVVPIMILFTLGLAFSRLPFLDLGSLLPHFPAHGIPYQWLISAFAYVSFNLVTAQAVLVPLGGDIRDKDVIRRGGLLGGVLLTLLLLASHMVLKGSSAVVGFQIPMAELIKGFGSVIHLLYVTVIFGEIFTTFIGNIFGLKRHLGQLFHIKEQYLMFFLLGGIYIISQIGYGPLLSHLYPFFGYLGLVFMFYIMIKGTRILT
ncbi:MAG: hypothetical protein ACO1OC_02425 [Tuberibacillus sp.]